jgi:hypothetical protein
MQQCVCKEEVTEFIGHVWLGNWQDRQNDRARRDCRKSHHQHGERLPPRQAAEHSFILGEPVRAQCWTTDGQDENGQD